MTYAASPESAPAPMDRLYPDIVPLVAHLATRHGLRAVVDVGRAWTAEAGLLNPRLRVTGVQVGAQAPSAARFPFRKVTAAAPGAVAAAVLNATDHRQAAVLVSVPSPASRVPSLTVDDVATLAARFPLVVVASPNGSDLRHDLAARALAPAFAGRTRLREDDGARSAELLVFDRSLEEASVRMPPDAFRVLAVMTAYNEADIIRAAIEKLLADGIEVHLIDNWSTDGTFEQAAALPSAGRLTIERFPDQPLSTFSLRSLLRRVEAVAASSTADWVMHHDADERRVAPWSEIDLRTALWAVERAGFNAVDHTVLNFRPVDDRFVPGSDFEAHFRYFEFGRTPDLLLQVKAWQNRGPVELAATGGHSAQFPRRRVFPYKFILKHYPARSQAHGQRKVLQERHGRWDPGEREQGWHTQYDDVDSEHRFLRSPDDLIAFEPVETRERFAPELLAGIGLAPVVVPAAATRSPTRRTIYRLTRQTMGSPAYGAVRRWRVLQAPAIRAPLLRVKAFLLGGAGPRTR
jgi:hypothetical protein